ncbi:MAG: oxygen-independent coproporphyrinogen III oxidase [Pseudomonadota bacterium]
MAEQSLDKYARRQVPRYTSYPTAPHFNPAFRAETYAGWLSSLDPAEPVSLYLHVPFCKQLCWYCGCNMKLASRAAPIVQYAATLMEEIKLLKRHLPGRMTVSHLHWGGGTPTTLPPDVLARIMEMIRADFDFLDGAELAIESDPRHLSSEMIRRIGHLGFTRASFGVQEFDPKVQAAINRIQPPDMVQTAVEGLRDAGVGGINFDLIYGLPHQTVASLLESIRLSVAMQPDRIAIFGYAHVPWMAKKQRLIDAAALPDTEDRLDQAQAASAALSRSGYVPIGLDHFALPTDAMAAAVRDGTLHRNFQGYTTDQAETLLGLGASSIGRTPWGYVQNISETGAWAKAIDAGTLPAAKGILVSPEDRLRGYVIERLMCFGEADLVAAADRFGAAPDWFLDTVVDSLDTLRADGLIMFEDGVVQVTDIGAPLVRVVASAFDRFFTATKDRHAIAV